jgi:hypothetical protein
MCNQTLRLPDQVAGKVIRCLKCKTIIMLPEKPAESADNSSAAEMIDFVEKDEPKSPNSP